MEGHPGRSGVQVAYARLNDPSQPESSARWDPFLHGDGWVPGGRLPIPARDLPAGLPAWMASSADWAERRAFGAVPERATLTITVPRAARDWSD